MPIISSKSKVLFTLSTSLSFLSSIGIHSVIARRMRLGLPWISVVHEGANGCYIQQEER